VNTETEGRIEENDPRIARKLYVSSYENVTFAVNYILYYIAIGKTNKMCPFELYESSLL
jgi:hypothetical protein